MNNEYFSKILEIVKNLVAKKNGDFYLDSTIFN